MTSLNTYDPISPFDSITHVFDWTNWLSSTDTIISATMFVTTSALSVGTSQISSNGALGTANNLVAAQITASSITGSFLISCSIVTQDGQRATRSISLLVTPS
jgi:hypothetical protein